MVESSKHPLGSWIPLMEYAIKKGISLSTLRRHIKAKKVTFRTENGRYLIWDQNNETDSSQLDQVNELSRAQFALKKAQEEIAELKTLIALYEENIPQERTER